jgi:hypothetical protein
VKQADPVASIDDSSLEFAFGGHQLKLRSGRTGLSVEALAKTGGRGKGG